MRSGATLVLSSVGCGFVKGLRESAAPERGVFFVMLNCPGQRNGMFEVSFSESARTFTALWLSSKWFVLLLRLALSHAVNEVLNEKRVHVDDAPSEKYLVLMRKTE